MGNSFEERVEDSFEERVEDSFEERFEVSFEEKVENCLKSYSEGSSTSNYQSVTLHLKETKTFLDIDLNEAADKS